MDELIRYADHNGTTHSVSLGGLGAGDLYARRLISSDEVAAIGDLVTIVDAGGRICQDTRPLDAWLTVFELVTSLDTTYPGQ